MFRNISLIAMFFTVTALLSGEADRLINGGVVIHSLAAASLFDPWLIVHYFSLALALLLVIIAAVRVMFRPPIRWSALWATAFLNLTLIAQLSLDTFSATIQAQEWVAIVHLLLGYVLVWCSFWMLLQSRPQRVNDIPQKALRHLTTLLSAALVLVLLSGIWTSVNNAGLACVDIAQCSSLWWAGLNLPVLLSDIGLFLNGQLPVLATEALSNISVWHFVSAGVTIALLVLLAIYGVFSKQPLAIRISSLSLAVLVLLVPGLGVLAVKSGLSLWVVIVHSGFAALLMLPLIAIRFFSRYEYLPVEQELAEILLEAEQEVIAEADYREPAPESLYLRLKSQLKKTRSGLGQVLTGISFGQRKIGADLLEELETSLILADVGMEAATTIIKRLKDKVERHQLNDAEVLLAALKQELFEILQPCSQPLVIPKQEKPYVILVVGINGVGKTTTIGKMAKRLQAQGHSVMLAAGDTFRAAAVEQLQVWGQRNKIHVVAQHTGADSASVIYDGIQSASAKGVDVLIADTAGRLHTKSNLMDELKKVKRIMAKLDESAPHEVLLVLDAGTGQNAISQTGLFNEAVTLTGLVLTKLDGTAKGGILFALAKQFGIPIRYIGIGEGIDDLQDFDANNFVDALFVKDD